MKFDLLKPNELPGWFSYPADFLKIVTLGFENIEPWHLFTGDELRLRQSGLKERYPSRELIPFARRQDCDDIACWEQGIEGVVIVHDYASPGWEQHQTYPSFWGWFRQAVEDMIEFD